MPPMPITSSPSHRNRSRPPRSGRVVLQEVLDVLRSAGVEALLRQRRRSPNESLAAAQPSRATHRAQPAVYATGQACRTWESIHPTALRVVERSKARDLTAQGGQLSAADKYPWMTGQRVSGPAALHVRPWTPEKVVLAGARGTASPTLWLRVYVRRSRSARGIPSGSNQYFGSLTNVPRRSEDPISLAVATLVALQPLHRQQP